MPVHTLVCMNKRVVVFVNEIIFVYECVYSAPSRVENLAAMFVYSAMDVSNRVWDISISISWSQPLYPNGEITSYSVTVYRTDNSTDVVYSNATLTDTSVTPSVMVPAFTDYTVTVAASTSAGQGEAVSLTLQSPQAGVCMYLVHIQHTHLCVQFSLFTA